MAESLFDQAAAIRRVSRAETNTFCPHGTKDLNRPRPTKQLRHYHHFPDIGSAILIYRRQFTSAKAIETALTTPKLPSDTVMVDTLLDNQHRNAACHAARLHFDISRGNDWSPNLFHAYTPPSEPQFDMATDIRNQAGVTILRNGDRSMTSLSEESNSSIKRKPSKDCCTGAENIFRQRCRWLHFKKPCAHDSP